MLQLDLSVQLSFHFVLLVHAIAVLCLLLVFVGPEEGFVFALLAHNTLKGFFVFFARLF